MKKVKTKFKMHKPKISIIAVISENKALGKDNRLLWHIPEDMKRFKNITTGHPIIMGRKTFESLGRPLPNRTNIVITRNPSFNVIGAVTVDSLDKALESARQIEKDEIFIIGGGQIFREAMPVVDKLYLTIVEGKYEADTFFPEYGEFKKIVFEQECKSGGYKYKFVELEK